MQDIRLPPSALVTLEDILLAQLPFFHHTALQEVCYMWLGVSTYDCPGWVPRTSLINAAIGDAAADVIDLDHLDEPFDTLQLVRGLAHLPEPWDAGAHERLRERLKGTLHRALEEARPRRDGRVARRHAKRLRLRNGLAARLPRHRKQLETAVRLLDDAHAEHAERVFLDGSDSSAEGGWAWEWEREDWMPGQQQGAASAWPRHRRLGGNRLDSGEQLPAAAAAAPRQMSAEERTASRRAAAAAYAARRSAELGVPVPESMDADAVSATQADAGAAPKQGAVAAATTSASSAGTPDVWGATGGRDAHAVAVLEMSGGGSVGGGRSAAAEAGSAAAAAMRPGNDSAEVTGAAASPAHSASDGQEARDAATASVAQRASEAPILHDASALPEPQKSGEEPGMRSGSEAQVSRSEQQTHQAADGVAELRSAGELSVSQSVDEAEAQESASKVPVSHALTSNGAATGSDAAAVVKADDGAASAGGASAPRALDANSGTSNRKTEAETTVGEGVHGAAGEEAAAVAPQRGREEGTPRMRLAQGLAEARRPAKWLRRLQELASKR